MTQLNIKYRVRDGKKTIVQDVDIELPADPVICMEYVAQEFNATSIISITDRKTGRVIE